MSKLSTKLIEAFAINAAGNAGADEEAIYLCIEDGAGDPVELDAEDQAVIQNTFSSAITEADGQAIDIEGVIEAIEVTLAVKHPGVTVEGFHESFLTPILIPSSALEEEEDE